MSSNLLAGGHDLELLEGTRAYFSAMVKAIDASLHEVRMETYIFCVEASGVQVAQALERAALRGVQVYLVMDGVGTPELMAPWTSRLTAAGVAWRIYLPLGRVGLLIPGRWRRLHRKLCVIDGEFLFCGGINVLDDFYDPNHGVLTAPRLDYAVGVRGPLVQLAHAAMLQFWLHLQAVQSVRDVELAAAWQAVQNKRRLASATVQHAAVSAASHTSAKAHLVLRDNVLHRRHIERAYRQALGEARSTIMIANAYFLPGRKIRQALIHAARRGLRVRLLLQGRYEYFMQYHATRALYQQLLMAGIEIYEYQASFMHAKVAVIDGSWATVGSSNMDPFSLLLAREANVVVHDSVFAAQLAVQLESAITKGAKPVHATELELRPWLQKTLDLGAYWLMHGMLLLTGRRY